MDNELISELELLTMIMLIEQMWMEWVFVLVTPFVIVCNVPTHYNNTICTDDDSIDNVCVDNDHVRVAHLDRVLHADDTTCIEQLRMNRRTFFKLCELLRIEGKLTSNGVVSMEEQVAMFLYILDFLLRAATPIGENCIDPRWKWFKNCLGALDGTHIKVKVAARDKTRYRNRKAEISTNVLGVCARDMQIIFMLSGWEGSASDSRVLRDAVSRPNGFKVPVGYYYLVDGGYTNGPGFLAPYRGVKYHLEDWRGRAPTNAREIFNLRHAQARNVIERTFGLLKIQWAILRSPSYYPIKTHNKIIIACALLHNFIRRTMPDDPFEHLLDESTQHEEADNIEAVETDPTWTTWRDNLANEMWHDWITNREQI